MSIPDTLPPHLDEYFATPGNEITRGLSATEPSIYQKYWSLVFPVLRGKKVIDVGAGKGRLSIPLAANGCDVTAIDLSAEGLAELAVTAQAKGVNVRTLQGNAMSLGLPAESLDGVFCVETLVHVPKVSDALKEFNRVLKDNGLLVVSVTLPLKLRGWLHLRGKEFFVAPIYASRLYQEYIRKLLRRPPRISREIGEREILGALTLDGFKPLYKFEVFSRYLLVLAKKSSEPTSPWLDACPYRRLYSEAKASFCMSPTCRTALPAAHGHVMATGECVCPNHDGGPAGLI